MSEHLEAFFSLNKDKDIVVIQGLGFVGSVMSLVCANSIKSDYAVIGIDLPTDHGKKIIDDLNNGFFPLVADDPKIDQFYQKALSKGNFLATYDKKAYSFADVIIIDVNLDVEKNNNNFGGLDGFNVDLSHFKSAIKTIGENCKHDALILVETTVPPGTCQKIIMPQIQECLKKRNLQIDEIRIGHSYERVMPGPGYIDSIQSFYRVYSGIDEKSADAVESFLHTIIRTDEYPLTRLDNTNATEMAKVLENSYRAMNIAFMVEWSRFAEEAGVNIYEVVDAIRLRPTHSNLMYPGIGVGGYCLTKDALLASWARQNLIGGNKPLSQSQKAISINGQMPHYAFEYLQKQYPDLNGSNILLLGISYRGDVGDTRSSPVEKLYDYLYAVGSIISCHDPYIGFWNEKKIEIEQNLEYHLSNSPDIIIISTGHAVYKSQETIDSILDLESVLVFDTIGLLKNTQISFLQKRHRVKVLGRGDL
tara:strand:- start:6736 stop:8166 length:1431 start_codon:yes stop_codon:yes gene_type:complete